MNDYISREAARPDAFCEGVSCQDCPFCKDPVQGGCRIDDFIKSIPAADVVERKLARWKGAGLGDYYCSLCNETYGIGAERVKNWHYCPNCGAKMDGGQDDGE